MRRRLSLSSPSVRSNRRRPSPFLFSFRSCAAAAQPPILSPPFSSRRSPAAPSVRTATAAGHLHLLFSSPFRPNPAGRRCNHRPVREATVRVTLRPPYASPCGRRPDLYRKTFRRCSRCSSAAAQPSQPVLSPSKPRPPREPVTATLPAHNCRSTCYRRRPTSCCNRSDSRSVLDGLHP